MKTTLSDKQKTEIISNYEKFFSTLQAWRMFKVNDMDHLKEKIREAVRSDKPVMLRNTYRELHARLVYLNENNGDHVEGTSH